MSCIARYCCRNCVHPSVCPSVRCMYCDKTKWWTANILIPHETAITLVFWHQHSWWVMPPSIWNLHSKWPTPFEKRQLWPISAHNASTVGDSEKVPSWRIYSRPRPFQRAIDRVCTLPLSAQKGGSKSDFFVFWVKGNGWSSQALST